MPLKILVTAKRVEDPESKIRVQPDGTGIVTDGVNYKMNPFDEIAVEEALRLKEKHGGEVVVVSIGGEKSRDRDPRRARDGRRPRHPRAARRARSTRWWSRRILAKVVEQEKPDLVLLGKQSIDDDQNQAGQYLAERLGLAAGDLRLQDGEPRERGRAEEGARPRALRRRQGRSRSCARWTAASRRSSSRCRRW